MKVEDNTMYAGRVIKRETLIDDIKQANKKIHDLNVIMQENSGATARLDKLIEWAYINLNAEQFKQFIAIASDNK
jgi:hypothetical protein